MGSTCCERGARRERLLALAAQRTGGRPVKMWWDRRENMLAGYKRHAVRMVYRLGAKNDGTLQALHCRLYYDTGAYAHLGGEVMELGMEHAGGPYRIPHVLIDARAADEAAANHYLIYGWIGHMIPHQREPQNHSGRFGPRL